MKIKYNAPMTLTFTGICVIVLALNAFVLPGLSADWFSVPGRGGFRAADATQYIRLFTHVIGHADLNHFLSNFAFILLIGPILEASYGSVPILLMTVVTAFVTGVLNILLFPSGLLGASGIVFMMILLASFTNFGKGEIPLTFILVMVLYLGREVLSSFQNNSVSEFAHIIGGLCGSLFGFLKPSRR
ncbi:MAG: rhomboid family intramembrane serine protease [Spirochaetes bacterium]|nr:rhomboid family intramembrane serine protease [Spirochaetota bacterium]